MINIDWLALFFIWVITICVALCIGVDRGKNLMIQNAIEAKVGSYTVDPKTGITAFVWKVEKK